MMSASARNSTTAKLVAAFAFAGALIVIAFGTRALGQVGAISQAETAKVTAMIARVEGASASEPAPPEAISLGQQLLVERRYPEAAQLFAALLGKWPRQPLALYGAALSAFNLHRAAEAEPLVRAAVEIYTGGDALNAKPVSPDQRQRAADALVLLAVVLGSRGADTEALKTVERAVALAPEHFDAQFTLGRALYGVGNSVAAVKAFRTALKLRPDDARALFFLATALEATGEGDAALGAYRELVRLRPDAVEGHVGLGVLLIKRGGAETEKGIAELRTAVRINPNQYEAQVTLGRALLMQKLPAESVEHLRRAAELAPANPEPHYQLALAYRRLGLNDKAVEETAIVKRIHETRRGEASQTNNAARPNE
jgi:tetratricopeptide (TPR) repeat protein